MKLFLQNPFVPVYFGLVIVQLLLFSLSFWSKNLVGLRKVFGVGLIVTPIVYFFLLLDAHTLNIPYTDDFNLLETIYNFQKADNFLDRTKILFEQVNQHRFAFERIVMLVLVFFTGTVNIKTQIIIGNLFLLGILYFLFKVLKREGISWYCFIPVPYLLFNLIYFENAYWGIAAIQNTPLLFFAFLTAYCIGQESSKGFYWGIAAALLTTFTSGSGLLTWIIGGVLLLFQKRYKWLAAWVIIAASCILFYFLFSYQVISSNGEKPWKHPVFNLISLFGFWGNAFYLDIRHPLVTRFYPDLIVCVLAGAGIGLMFVLWFFKVISNRKQFWTDWFLWGAMMFGMWTGAMLVISRPMQSYLMYGGNVLSRRYMIFGVVLLATVFVCALVLTKRFKKAQNVLVAIGLLVFVALNFISYYLSVFQIRKLHDDLVIDSYYWKNYNTFLTAGEKFGDIPFWNHPTRMRNLVQSLESSGLTHFYQNASLPPHKQLIRKTADQAVNPDWQFDATFHYRNTDNNVSTKYYTFKADASAWEVAPSYFVLASPGYTILLPALPAPNTPGNMLKTGQYYSSTVQYALFKTKLPAGQYRAWMLYREPSRADQWKSSSTGRQVLVN